MAARHLPIAALTHTISIGADFTASPAGIVVAQGDTVNFTNNSGSDITIQFLSNTPGQNIYPNMSLPVTKGTTAGFTVPNANCAANYNVTLNGQVMNGTPYVIQVGSGPMYVLVTGSLASPDFNPATVAVPLGSAATGMGYLQMQSQIPNVVVPIYWTTDPFNPGITQSGPAQPVKSGTSTGSYSYSNTPQPRPHAMVGGGTVIIKSS